MEVKSVFISFAEEDINFAKILKQGLEKKDIEVWLYTQDIAHGNDIETETIKALKACDHLLVVLSPASKESEWVSRELGFIFHRRKKRNASYPNIVGVRFNSDFQNYILDVRDFYSKEKIDEYNFGLTRCFDIKPGTADSFEDLAKSLKPTVTHIEDNDNADQMKLLESSFDCYEELFPDEGERDDPVDIMEWLEDVRDHKGDKNYPWFDIWSVFHIKDYPIGLVFLTIHNEYPLWFGNYFGLRKDFRQLNRAKTFLEDVIKYAYETIPEAKGILFEVDPVDFDFLEAVSDFLYDEDERKYKVDKTVRISTKAFFDWLVGVVKKLPSFSHFSEKDVYKNIRFLRRLWLYNRHAYIINDDLGNPIQYWQPAMSKPLNETDEKILYFMVYLFDGYTEKDIDMFEVADFIYDEFYGSAYGDPNSPDTYIEGYEDYLPTVKNRFVAQLSKGYNLGKVPKSRKIRELKRVLDFVAPEKIAL